MYFASNQSKQKGFDRYFNAKAKSDFKQGVKLKALINKEAADSALAEQLASMYMQAVGKSREYDYDTVNDKLGRKAPSVVKDSKTGLTKVNIKKGKKQPKRVYVHKTTDSKKSASEGPSGIEDELEEKAPIPPEYIDLRTPESSPPSSPPKRPPPPPPSPPKSPQNKPVGTLSDPELRDFIDEPSTRTFVADRAKHYDGRKDKFKSTLQRDIARYVSDYKNAAKQGRANLTLANRVSGASRTEVQNLLYNDIVSEIEQRTPPSSPVRSRQGRSAQSPINLVSSSSSSSSTSSSPARSRQGRSAQSPINVASSSSSSSSAPSSPARAQPSQDRARSAPSSPTQRAQKHGRSPLSILRKSPNKGPKKRQDARTHEDDDFDAEFRVGLEDEQRNRKLAPIAREVYDIIIKDTSRSKQRLYDNIKQNIAASVDQTKGKDYFKENAPKPSEFGAATANNMEEYKKEMKGWLEGIFGTH